MDPSLHRDLRRPAGLNRAFPRAQEEERGGRIGRVSIGSNRALCNSRSPCTERKHAGRALAWKSRSGLNQVSLALMVAWMKRKSCQRARAIDQRTQCADDFLLFYLRTWCRYDRLRHLSSL